ncbi:MAG: hypothetical protein WEC12_02220 [Balneolaceae bacterium]
MDEGNESEFEAWQEDVEFLVKTLADIFESGESGYYTDEMNNTLVIELEGLGDYDDEEIIELAEPVLSELDLDFEDVILLPMSD